MPPLRGGTTPQARLQALWTLEGMQRLEGNISVQALGDSDPMVRAAAIRLCEPLLIPATMATQAAALKTLGVLRSVAGGGAGAVAVEVRAVGVSNDSLMRRMMPG